MFPLQSIISSALVLPTDLQGTEGEGLVAFGFMEIVTQFAIDGTNEVEEEGV
jgi:hypothetical protein